MSHISSIKCHIVEGCYRSWLLDKWFYKSFVPDYSLIHQHILHIFLTAEYCENLSQNLQLRENHKWRENHQSSEEKKTTLYTVLQALQNLSAFPSNTHTHKHIGTNTYTSKQRCHFTQEGSAVLSIRQGLVLGQRLLPNLRPPSPGSTGPLWPPSGPHHPGDKLPIVPALLINDSSPVQTNFRAHSKHTHTHPHTNWV